MALAWDVRDVDHDSATLVEYERQGTPEGEAERELWRAVLARALRDAEGDTTPTSRGENRERLVADARRFLTTSLSPWSEHREWICLAADVDPDSFTDACRRRLREVRAAARGTEVALPVVVPFGLVPPAHRRRLLSSTALAEPRLAA